MAFEVKIQGKDAALEGTAVSVFPRTVPLPVDDFKGDIFVRGAGADAKDGVVLGVTRLETIRRQL